MVLDSEEQRKTILALIDNSTIKCGNGVLEAMHNLKSSLMSAKVSSDTKS